ncbi:MAG: nucleoside triphosphate pyrophosphohydrolase [Nitrospiraceae bacterium]
MSDSFNRVVEIMATLRAPGGCPWDRKQTHESLRPYLLEETYEVLETIDQRETTKLKEELGDILLQVLFHSQIATEEGTFTVNDVVQQLGDKLVRRHPHVFHDPVSGKETMNADQVVHRWEDIKRAERQASGKSESVLQDVPKTLPALLRAFQIQARAARVGFDWPDNPQGLKQVFDKIEEELRELRDAWNSRHEQADTTSSEPPPIPRQQDAVAAEFGDVLFSLVNFSRHLKVNPEDALRQATNRFAERFRYIEDQAARSGRSMSELSLEEMDRHWETAKALADNDRQDAGTTLDSKDA